jgi:hypothetical protein
VPEHHHTPPRYLPARPFPSYAFIPGHTPHPYKDPAGHSYGADEPPATALTGDGWAAHPGYLFGVDLYNHGFPWEAHEAWEGPWRLAPRESPERVFLQGLIQCSAAVVKALAGQPAGVASLTGTALPLLERVAGMCGPRYMGMDDIPEFVADFRAFAAGYPGSRERWPRIALRMAG